MKKIFEQIFNTPETDWVIACGYHLHKSFWGVILLIFSLLIFIFGKDIFIIFATAGGILILFSIVGHIYTNNHPYFKLWDKYKKSN